MKTEIKQSNFDQVCECDTGGWHLLGAHLPSIKERDPIFDWLKYAVLADSSRWRARQWLKQQVGTLTEEDL